MNIEDIKQKIKTGKKIDAQSAIMSRMDSDRFRKKMEVAEILEEIEALGSQLFDKDDGKTQFLKKNQWGREYWTTINVELSNNFSKEKLRHAVEVMIYLRDQGHPKFSPREKVHSRPIQIKTRSGSRSKLSNGKAAVSILAGTGAGAVFGAIAAKSAVKGLILGGVVGAGIGIGIAYLFFNRKD